MPTRLSRPEQVERNRAQLLSTARQAFLRRGYTGATLDALADEAGFTKGVVYSHFAGKSDLFLALLEQRIEERAEENDRLVDEHPGPGVLAALLQANARRTTEGAEWARLLIEFRTVAARDPGLNARYAALHERSLDRMNGATARALERDGLVPVYPLATFVELIFALNSGVVLEQAAGVAAFTPDLLEDLVARLVVPR